MAKFEALGLKPRLVAGRKTGWAALILIMLSATIAGVAALSWPGPSQAGLPAQQSTEDYCLSCHANPELSITLPDGEELSLYISPEDLAGSVHSPAGIECHACHTTITDYPHPKIDFSTRRELSRSYYLSCQKCHSDLYDRTQDSIHAQMAAAGNEQAPICTDCHGAHDVQPPDQPRTMVSQTCGTCHQEEYGSYQESVHGAALIGEGNEDVPVCTDCHGVHDIHDPRTAQFRVETPELCANCHADVELMAKYGLSTDVYSIYKVSWHGADVSIYQARWPNLWHKSAVCTDCHGVHEILDAENPESSVHPANLLETCQKCHPGASPNFAGAWTGHNRISLEQTPFVFYTDLFYNSFASSVLWMSAVYVFLQILRGVVARVRRALS